MLSKNSQTVCVMGMGYVGLTLSVVLAESGYQVSGVEINKEVADQLRAGIPSFHEETLTPRLNQQLRSKKLEVVDKVPEQTHFDCFIISVGTPLIPGKKVPNLDYINKVLEDVGRCLKRGALVCMRSTIPVGLTREKVIPTLEKISGLKAGEDFHVAFTPERTIEGKALIELLENPQIIGGLTTNCVEQAANFFLKITPTVLRVSSLEAAELCKIMDNSYRDVRFAYANEMAIVAEHLNLDVGEVIKACNTHYPRNNIPVPSPGVGGACLSKDPHILVYFSEKAGYSPELISKSRAINEHMPKRIVDRIQQELKAANKDLKTATVTIAGFAFKGNPETSDLRDSTTLWLLNEIKKHKGCKVKGYDPVIKAKDLKGLEIEPFDNIEDALAGSDVLIIANNHKQYLNWDLTLLTDRMNKNPVIFDGWRMLDKKTARSLANVSYIGVGV